MKNSTFFVSLKHRTSGYNYNRTCNKLGPAYGSEYRCMVSSSNGGRKAIVSVVVKDREQRCGSGYMTVCENGELCDRLEQLNCDGAGLSTGW